MPYTDLTSRLFRPAEGFYTTVIEKPRKLPVRTFLPTGYEPNYPYPLLVFFHAHGGNEEQILRLAPRLSRRNFICIGLRAPELVGPRADGSLGYTWNSDGLTDSLIEDYVLGAIEQTRRTYHVHSERIYLTGFCEGSTMAYRLGLKYPEKFGGIVALNGNLPPRGSLFLRLDAVRRFKVFMGHGIANAIVPLVTAKSDFRMLYTAGLDVCMQTYPTTHKLHAHMLRDINRWVIDQFAEPAFTE